MSYIVEVPECFLLKDHNKLFCYAVVVDPEKVIDDSESEEVQGYLAIVKIDKFYETTLNGLPESIREIVRGMPGAGK